MKTIYTYLKNSNTGDIITKQEFTECIINFPTLYYRDNKSIDIPDLSGYIEITEKKYKQLMRKK